MKLLVKLSGVYQGSPLKTLTLLLLRYFQPTKLTCTPSSSYSSELVVTLVGATPINPYQALDDVKKIFAEKQGWAISYDILEIEMENEEEKDQIVNWILIDKIK